MCHAGDLTLSGGEPKDQKDVRPVVICGFGEIGQTVANMLESPFAISLERGKVPYVAFEMSPHRLEAAREAGFNVMYGDATRPQVTVLPPSTSAELVGVDALPLQTQHQMT